MRRGIACAGIGVALALCVSVPAGATFPGGNGRLAYSVLDGPLSGRQIYSIEPDGTDRARLTTANHARLDPSWSPDGASIAYVARSDRGDMLRIMAADGSASRVVVTGPFEGYRTPRSPTFSPDGTQLAFCGRSPIDEDHPFARVFVVNVDGTGLAAISNWRHPNCFLSWSPDGSKIAAGTYGRDGTAIVTIDAGGGDRQIVVGDELNFTPEWSPDGSHLVFLRFGAIGRSSDVFTVRADGRGLTDVTNTPRRSELLPTYSPDGTSIAFSRRGSGDGYDLWVANVDGSGAVRVTMTPRSEIGVDWQPI
jgi:Tol biopolymer transport system component